MPLPQRHEPQPGRPDPQRRPELVPPPKRPDRGRKWLLAAALVVAAAAGIVWQLQPQAGFGGGSGGGGIAAIRAMPADSGKVEHTLRLTGTTAAERYVTIKTPRLRGSRSRRGSSMTGASIGVKSGITVNSTSSVASESTISSLSETGFVATSSGAATAGGGTGQGGSSVSSSRLSASTSRVGGSGGSGSGGGNITTSSAAAATAMGSSGLGSTSRSVVTGGGGGGRGRGDFHLSLQTIVEAGTRVNAGDEIAVFDNQYMSTRLDDYEASVRQHEAEFVKDKTEVGVTRKAHDHSVESAKSQLEKAKLDLRSIPVLSAIQAERTRLALEEAQAEYEQLLGEVPLKRVSETAELKNSELQVHEAQVELQRTENSVAKLVVKAPIDGMAVRMSVFRNGEMGQVKEGDELFSGQPFLQVVDTSSMVVDATVNQVDVDKLRIGQRARITFDAFPDLELPARVYSIGTVAKARQYRQEYVTEIPVKLKLEKTEARVIPDLTVGADVILEEEADVTILPVGAIQADEESGRSYVYVKSGNDWVRRDVETGTRNNIWVAIRSGVKPGEEVALERPDERPVVN